jgi:hypothetical protein
MDNKRELEGLKSALNFIKVLMPKGAKSDQVVRVAQDQDRLMRYKRNISHHLIIMLRNLKMKVNL